MDLGDGNISAGQLWKGELLPDLPCLFVEECRDSEIPDRIDLPDCPVILIGEGPARLAEAVDARVADHSAAQTMLDRVAANPLTAKVITGLLRTLPDLSLDHGLQMESLAYGVLQGSDEFRRWLAERPHLSPTSEGRIASERRGGVLELTFDRPEADNAIDVAMRDQLTLMFQLAAIDQTIQRIVLRGNGRSFSLGADLAEFGTTTDPAQAHAIRRQTLPARWAAACADRLEAHIHGACVGAGLELAAYARTITASPRAWFQLPELAMGLLPGAGGCVSLTRRIGRQRTAEMIFSGSRISARTALEWGLVDEITADDGGANVG